jgi:uncharacterized membrane protein
MTVGQLLKHDFSKGSLYLYDSNGNEIYTEFSDRTWYKQDYDNNSNEIYFETSNGYWSKSDYDSNGNRIYYENSNGRLIVSYKRPKKDYCNGKVVEIDGKKYKLTEV